MKNVAGKQSLLRYKNFYSARKSVKSQRCALVQRETDFVATVISHSFDTHRILACYRPMSPYANVDLYNRIHKPYRMASGKNPHHNRVYKNVQQSHIVTVNFWADMHGQESSTSEPYSGSLFRIGNLKVFEGFIHFNR